jgi:hypothetical protein
MRFSDKRYYIEEYIKCANCGVLIYDAGVPAAADVAEATEKSRLYCSDWCRQWATLRESGDTETTLPLPRQPSA